MDIIAEVHSDLLTAAQREGGHVTDALGARDLFEGNLLAERIHHELPVEREGWRGSRVRKMNTCLLFRMFEINFGEKYVLSNAVLLEQRLCNYLGQYWQASSFFR